MSARRLLPAILLVLGLLVAALAQPATEAGASDGYNLTGVRDMEGNGVWHADPYIPILWDPNPGTSGTAVRHLVYSSAGEWFPEYTGSDAGSREGAVVPVPPVPGAYRVELVDMLGPNETGGSGPPVSIYVYFDNVRPGPISVSAPRWVAAGTDATIHVTAPAAPQPISGIRGYAVSIDGAAAGSPCARVDRCVGSEIDLPGGIGDVSIDIPAPPEGISYVHAAAVSGSGMMSTQIATTAVGVDATPPQVRLEGAPTGWAAGPVPLRAQATDPLSGMAAAGHGGPVTTIAVDDGPPLVAEGATATTTVTGEGTHKVTYWGRDALGNAGDGSLPFVKPGTATIRIDETDPTVRFAAGDAGDPERIEASVADALSGPGPARGEIALRRVGSPGRFQPLPTEADRGRLVARWNSDDFPHGPYEFRAVGYDAAGNSATTTAAPDGGPFVLHNPVKGETHLAFGFGGRRLVFQRCARADGARRCHRAVVGSFTKRPAARAVPCCHGARVGGRLLDAGGTPLAGQEVDVVETFARGSRHAVRRTPVTTDADGAFGARLAPGASRTVSAEFAGTRLLTRAAGRSLRLRVRAGIRLRVSTTRVRVGGAPVIFRGRVLHPESRIPKTGLPVELEFRLPGTPWSEFRTLQTAPDGHFAYPYSFSDDDSAGVRFLFRALVPATGNWPFAPATSRPLAVTG